ncbi:MAG TPA: hypothetical protein VIS94_04285 [Desulfomonilia bacterium]
MKKISIIPAAFLMVLVFAVSSQAVDFRLGGTDLSVGGSARLDAGWQYNDKGDVGDGEAGNNTKMFVTIPSDTNIYLRAKSENLLGYVELGLSNSHLNVYNSDLDYPQDKGAVRIRYAYGQYTFNINNEILIGQTDCLFSQLTPKQYLYDDNGMQGFGVVMSDRYPQIRYTYKQNRIIAQVAIQQPLVNDPDDFKLASEPNEGIYEANEILPAIAGSITYKINNDISIIPNFYFQYYKFKANSSEVNDDIDVTTFGLCVNADAKINIVELTGGIWWGVNLGIFGNDRRFNLSGDSTVFGAPVGNHYADGTLSTGIKNNQSFGGWVQAAVNAGPGLLRLGLGGQRAQTGVTDHGYTEHIYTWGMFANYTYMLVKNFSIAPEIVFMNNGYDVDRSNLGNTTLAGVHFQYDF